MKSPRSSSALWQRVCFSLLLLQGLAPAAIIVTGFTQGQSGAYNGSADPWADSAIYVGFYGTGTLSISGASQVSDANGLLGYFATDHGTATVSGGSWTNSSGIYVGYSGTGVLNVTGGTVSNTVGYLGFYAGSSGTVTVSSGSWTNSSDVYVGLYSTGVLNLTDTGVVNVGGLAGTGTVSLGFYAGSSGTLNLGTGGVAGTLNAATAVVNFNHTGSYTFAPTLSGTLAVNKLGAGTTILTGANTYTGLTTVSVGTLQVGNGEANTSVGASSFSVASGARLVFSRNTDSTDFTTQAISGAGDVEFKGQSTGYVRFHGGYTAALTYTGRTIVNFDAPVGGTAGYQRVLWLEKDDVLPHASVLELQSGKVYLRNNTTLGETIGGLTGNAGTYISTDQTLVQKLTIDTASGGPHTYAGVVGVDPTWVSSTSNVSLTKTGAGTQILTGANTYTGDTTVSAGTLQLGNGGPINTPKDAEYILSKTTADGFVGASSLERMGVEDSLTNLTREFKRVPLGR